MLTISVAQLEVIPPENGRAGRVRGITILPKNGVKFGFRPAKGEEAVKSDGIYVVVGHLDSGTFKDDAGKDVHYQTIVGKVKPCPLSEAERTMAALTPKGF